MRKRQAIKVHNSQMRDCLEIDIFQIRTEAVAIREMALSRRSSPLRRGESY